VEFFLQSCRYIYELAVVISVAVCFGEESEGQEKQTDYGEGVALYLVYMCV
jgi:hypothetical protein